MNQLCKVCGEPAAGFHFGAFTCEGCKSFFGRSHNNLTTVTECKNNNQCVINKKNRTACKACRLNKCIMVGMSKNGSRYGRRSNWFKIHCLLQQDHLLQQNGGAGTPNSVTPPQRTPPSHHNALGLGFLGPQAYPPSMGHMPKTKEDMMLLGMDEYKLSSASPSVSSPESHNSDSSVEFGDARRWPLFPGLLPHTFLPHPGLLFTQGYPPIYPGLFHPNTNNNNRLMRNQNVDVEAFNKRILLDAVLQSQRSPTPEEPEPPVLAESPIQEDPIDLSMKTMSERGSSPNGSDRSAYERGAGSEADEQMSDCNSERGFKRRKLLKPTPLNLTNK